MAAWFDSIGMIVFFCIAAAHGLDEAKGSEMQTEM